jgi:hypothetical protein
MDLKPKIRTGMPAKHKPNPRGDFRPYEFEISLLTMGYRMWWSRAGICPCENNNQTEQPDPTCQLCKGSGYYYFLPDPAVAAGARVDSSGNEILVNTNGDAVQIIALMTSLTQDVQVFEKFGEWVFGTSRCTVQSQNKLGYRDRLTSVESHMTWAQIIEYKGGVTIPITGSAKKSGLRYPFVEVHQFRSVAALYREGSDFILTPQGEITWLITPPDAGTRLTIHGVVHPSWIVMDHVNTYRDTNLTGKTVLPRDQVHVALPVQAVVKLDFLVDP